MSKSTLLSRKRRHLKIRKNIIGTAQIPRMSVFRSLRHMYVQLIDDVNQRSLFGSSTLSKRYKELVKGHKNNKHAAEVLGKILAETAIEKGIKKIVFDRGGYKYHGRIKAMADTARKSGLEF